VNALLLSALANCIICLTSLMKPITSNIFSEMNHCLFGSSPPSYKGRFPILRITIFFNWLDDGVIGIPLIDCFILSNRLYFLPHSWFSYSFSSWKFVWYFFLSLYSNMLFCRVSCFFIEEIIQTFNRWHLGFLVIKFSGGLFPFPWDPRYGLTSHCLLPRVWYLTNFLFLVAFGSIFYPWLDHICLVDMKLMLDQVKYANFVERLHLC